MSPLEAIEAATATRKQYRDALEEEDEDESSREDSD